MIKQFLKTYQKESFFYCDSYNVKPLLVSRNNDEVFVDFNDRCKCDWSLLYRSIEFLRKFFNSSNSKVTYIKLGVILPDYSQLIIDNSDLTFSKSGASLYSIFNQIVDIIFWEEWWEDDLFYDTKISIDFMRIIIKERGHRKSNLPVNRRPKRSISYKTRVQVFDRDDYTCQMCGASVKDGAKLHVDHIIPISKGGSNDISNLQTLCSKCNVGKSDNSNLKIVQNKINELGGNND